MTSPSIHAPSIHAPSIHDRLSGIENVVAPAGATEAAAARRAKSRIRGLHHHAIYAKEFEATRHFYEDLLELKMVLAIVDEGDIDPSAPTPFLHFFFELGDGSMIAFFHTLPIHGGGNYPPLTIFDHHLSMQIPDQETSDYFKARLEAAGYKIFAMEHGFCNSIYVDDPNGIHIELSVNTSEFDDHFNRAEIVARQQLDRWIANRAREAEAKTTIETPESVPAE